MTGVQTCALPICFPVTIKRGAGLETGGKEWETIMYEGYAAGGVALLIECLSDNRNRAASEVRVAVTRNGGNMADPGSVSYLFNRKGVVLVSKDKGKITEDSLLEVVLDAGADEVNDLGESFEVVAQPSDLVAVRTSLQAAGIDYESAETSKEESERRALAETLAKLGDFYVGDGFGAVHRKHASVFELAKILPHAAGKLIAAEVSVLQQLTVNPARPYTVVLGGAKVSDKIGVITNLLQKVDRIAIGGGMVFTFLKATGFEVGKSLLELDSLETVNEILKKAKEFGVEILLPSDVVVAPSFADELPKVVSVAEIPSDQLGLDIGPESAEKFAAAIESSATVFW